MNAMRAFLVYSCMISAYSATTATFAGVSDPHRALAGLYDVTGARPQLLRQISADRVLRSPDAVHVSVDDELLMRFGCQGVNASSLADHCVVLAFSVSANYTWEGVAGNTGPQVGPSVWRSLNSVCDLAFADTVAVYAVGYNERGASFGMTASGAGNVPVPLGHDDYHRAFPFAATDGNIAYFANTGIVASNSSYYHLPVTFVIGVDLVTRCEHNFTVGGRTECEEGNGQGNCTVIWDGCNGGEQYWSSVIDYVRNEDILNGSLADAATGMAVQRDPDTYLAVAHGWRDRVHVFDKRSGAWLCNATANVPRALAFDASGAKLWGVTADGVVRWSVPTPAQCAASPGASWPVDLVLGPAAVQLPGAIAVGRASNRLFVADLETQQIRVFNGSTGAALVVFGRAGGYGDGNTTVDVDRFWFLPSLQGGGFSNSTGLGRGTVIGVEDTAEEAIWVGDAGNRRVLRLNSTDGSSAGDMISYLPRSYKSAVHPTDPTRVFSNFLEFSVSYSSNASYAESWRLVRNWGAGTPAAFTAMDDDYGLQRWPFAGFSAVAAAGNVTVGLVGAFPNAPYNTSGEYTQMVQLVDGSRDGSVPPHLVMLQNFTKGGFALAPDASVRYIVDAETPPSAYWQELWSVPMTLNSSGYPQWVLPGVLLASFNVSANASQGMRARGAALPLQLPVTSNGNIILLDATNNENGGDHLAGIPVNGTALAWTACPWGTWEMLSNRTTLQPGNVTLTYRWISNADGQYGANTSSISYSAAYPMAIGPHVLFSFYGEGWNQGEANQFLHFTEDGMFVGQFGTLNFPDTSALYALPGAAGNSFSTSLVQPQAGGPLYLYHNDESAHGGVHRWRIDVSAMQLLQRL